MKPRSKKAKPVVQKLPDAVFNRWRAEEFLFGKLVERKACRLIDITHGDTTFEIRRDRARAVIIQAKLQRAVIGKKNAVAENFASYFERLYGEAV